MSEAVQSNEIIIELHEVTYAVQGNSILNGLDLKIKRGEILILLGESGCGKTTTLKLINRLIEPTGGAVLVEGKSVMDWEIINLRRRIGYVLQEGGLFPHYTVAENVALIPRLENWSAEKIASRTAEMLEMVGLNPQLLAERFPHELSGGQIQRVGVARALAGNAPILLLDEPFGALDPLTRHALQNEFAALVRSLQKTAVFVTHDLHEALRLGTRIALMNKGEIILEATPGEFRRSTEPLAKAYLETIADNFD